MGFLLPGSRQKKLFNRQKLSSASPMDLIILFSSIFASPLKIKPFISSSSLGRSLIINIFEFKFPFNITVFVALFLKFSYNSVVFIKFIIASILFILSAQSLMSLIFPKIGFRFFISFC